MIIAGVVAALVGGGLIAQGLSFDGSDLAFVGGVLLVLIGAGLTIAGLIF